MIGGNHSLPHECFCFASFSPSPLRSRWHIRSPSSFIPTRKETKEERRKKRKRVWIKGVVKDQLASTSGFYSNYPFIHAVLVNIWIYFTSSSVMPLFAFVGADICIWSCSNLWWGFSFYFDQHSHVISSPVQLCPHLYLLWTYIFIHDLISLI